MGRGNAIFRTYEGDGVRTFYFDSKQDFDSVKKDYIGQEREELAGELFGLRFDMRRRKVEQMLMDGRLPVRVSDDTIYERMGEFEMDDINNLKHEIAAIEGFKALKQKDFKYESELSCANDMSAVVIAESDLVLVCVQDNESNTAIAMVPAFTKDRLREDVDEDWHFEEARTDMERTRKRADANYEITASDVFEAARKTIDDDVDARYEERMSAYREQANAAMRKVHEFFGTDGISAWSSAWTSSRMPTPSEMDAKDEKYY